MGLAALLALARLRPPQKARSDSPSLELGGDHGQCPRPSDNGVRHDPIVELDHSGVGREVKVARTPFIEQVLEREIRYPQVGQVTGNQHRQDRRRIIA
jgi:hypothetical protein